VTKELVPVDVADDTEVINGSLKSPRVFVARRRALCRVRRATGPGYSA
jgi:hypothetical protein